MKFLIDVNASGIVARWLVAAGHDVAEVVGEDPGLTGEAILAWPFVKTA